MLESETMTAIPSPEAEILKLKLANIVLRLAGRYRDDQADRGRGQAPRGSRPRPHHRRQAGARELPRARVDLGQRIVRLVLRFVASAAPLAAPMRYRSPCPTDARRSSGNRPRPSSITV